jgi:tetratricopeptide (TPR) repeat protein
MKISAWITILSAIMTAGCAPKPQMAVMDYPPYQLGQTDAAVAINERAVSTDPESALGWSMLAASYLNRSRETDSVADARKAEDAARRSLRLRKSGNYGPADRIVQSLLQQHRFKDAYQAVLNARQLAGDYPPTLMLQAEVLIELGRYAEAERILEFYHPKFQSPQGLAIEARLLQINGRSQAALSVLLRATTDVDGNYNNPRETVAWFHNKLGDQLAAMGRLDDADAEQEHAIEIYPRCYKAMASLTRAAAARKNWSAVLAWGRRCNDICEVIDVHSLMGDAYAQQGDGLRAEKQYQSVASMAGRPQAASDSLHEFATATSAHGHTLDRQYAIFAADHHRDLEGAYACALRDLDARRDIYAFDTLAWVCYQRGQVAEARKAMQLALCRGTQDRGLLLHAALILGGTNGESTFMARAVVPKGPITATEEVKSAPPVLGMKGEVR